MRPLFEAQGPFEVLYGLGVVVELEEDVGYAVVLVQHTLNVVDLGVQGHGAVVLL